MTIEEKKEKVARYMGLEQQTDPDKRWFGQWFNLTTSQRYERLNYDFDWGWIMPVVEKIQEKNFFIRDVETSLNFIISYKYCKVVDENEKGLYRKEYIVPDYGDIVTYIFEAVVDVIDWIENREKPEDIELLLSFAESHIEDLASGIEDGTYEDDGDLKLWEELDLNHIRAQLERANNCENLALRYNNDEIDALNMGEELREIFKLK